MSMDSTVHQHEGNTWRLETLEGKHAIWLNVIQLNEEGYQIAEVTFFFLDIQEREIFIKGMASLLSTSSVSTHAPVETEAQS